MKKPHLKQLLSGKTLDVAQGLIGQTLVFHSPQGVLKGIINETEAYTEEDPACHAFNGRNTPRTQTMFLPAGHLYIYLIYGMYHCANIVTEENGRGCAVLLRSVIPIQGLSTMKQNRGWTQNNLSKLCNGPGKLCLAYGWNHTHNGLNLLKPSSPVQIEMSHIAPTRIQQTTRIGISKGQDLAWRFWGQFDHLS